MATSYKITGSYGFGYGGVQYNTENGFGATGITVTVHLIITTVEAAAAC